MFYVGNSKTGNSKEKEGKKLISNISRMNKKKKVSKNVMEVNNWNLTISEIFGIFQIGHF